MYVRVIDLYCRCGIFYYIIRQYKIKIVVHLNYKKIFRQTKMFNRASVQIILLNYIRCCFCRHTYVLYTIYLLVNNNIIMALNIEIYV